MEHSTGGNELTLEEIGVAVKNGEKVVLVVCPTSGSLDGVVDARRFAFALKEATSGCETIVHSGHDKFDKRTAVSISKVLHGEDEYGAILDEILDRDIIQDGTPSGFEEFLWTDDEYPWRVNIPVRIFVTSATNVRNILAKHLMTVDLPNVLDVVVAIKGKDGTPWFGRLMWKEDAIADEAMARKAAM